MKPLTAQRKNNIMNTPTMPLPNWSKLPLVFTVSEQDLWHSDPTTVKTQIEQIKAEAKSRGLTVTTEKEIRGIIKITIDK